MSFQVTPNETFATIDKDSQDKQVSFFRLVVTLEEVR